MFRQGYGGNRRELYGLLRGRRDLKGWATLDVGLRYDRQGGRALPSQTLANAAFPNAAPGIVFAGYDAPFTWRNFSPRAGVTYAIDDSHKTVATLTTRYAGAEHGHGGVSESDVHRWFWSPTAARI